MKISKKNTEDLKEKFMGSWVQIGSRWKGQKDHAHMTMFKLIAGQRYFS